MSAGLRCRLRTRTSPEDASAVRRQRLSGMQLTIIIVIALLTIVPSTAAAVTVTYTSIVDAKTGEYAQVSNDGQLQVRGEVTTRTSCPRAAGRTLSG